MAESGLQKSVEKMRAGGVADLAIRNFEHYYRQLEAGETGLVPEDSIEPASDLPEFDELPHDADAEREAVRQQREILDEMRRTTRRGGPHRMDGE